MSTIKNQLEPITLKANRSQSISKDGLNRVRLQSNNVFAFQEDYFCFDPNEHNLNENDTFYIPNTTNLENSCFFSTYHDQSQLLKLNDSTTEKQTEDDIRCSYFTYDLDLEKQITLLTDCEDDDIDILNDAKLSVNNDISLLSEQSNPLSNKHNMTTPSKRIPIEVLDTKSSNIINPHSRKANNVNILSQQSFTSLFETNHPELSSGCSLTSNLKTLNSKPMINTIHNPTSHHLSSFDNQSSNSIDFTKALHQSTQLHYDMKNKFNPEVDSFHSMQPTTALPIHKALTNKMPFFPYSFCIDRQNWSQMNKCMFDLSYMSHSPNMVKKDNMFFSDNLILMIKDQNGSMVIQKHIEEQSPQFLLELYEKIKGHLEDIICNQYGNYVIQKYVKYCDKKIISQMFKVLEGKLYEISINSYGTRALQKMIKYCSIEDDMEMIIKLTQDHVFQMIKDINGNHVIQSIIQGCDVKALSSMYKEMNIKMIEIAKLKQGGCVFPQILSKSLEEDRDMIIMNLIDHIDILINDDIGNIIFKHIINTHVSKYALLIYDYISKRIVKLSSQRFSSYLIQECIVPECSIREKVIDKLIEKNNIMQLVIDEFGNYIVQRSLQHASESQFYAIIEQIKKSVKSLNQTSKGKIIYEKLLFNYGDYLQPQQYNNNNHNDQSRKKYINKKSKK